LPIAKAVDIFQRKPLALSGQIPGDCNNLSVCLTFVMPFNNLVFWAAKTRVEQTRILSKDSTAEEVLQISPPLQSNPECNYCNATMHKDINTSKEILEALPKIYMFPLPSFSRTDKSNCPLSSQKVPITRKDDPCTIKYSNIIPYSQEISDLVPLLPQTHKKPLGLLLLKH